MCLVKFLLVLMAINELATCLMIHSKLALKSSWLKMLINLLRTKRNAFRQLYLYFNFLSLVFAAMASSASLPMSVTRFIGSLVRDIHRNLIKGGIYIYPAIQKSVSGKLRLLYECYLMAFIVEQAGGKATNGIIDMLDVEPLLIHGRSPFFAGAPEMMYDFTNIICR